MKFKPLILAVGQPQIPEIVLGLGPKASCELKPVPSPTSHFQKYGLPFVASAPLLLLPLVLWQITGVWQEAGWYFCLFIISKVLWTGSTSCVFKHVSSLPIYSGNPDSLIPLNSNQSTLPPLIPITTECGSLNLWHWKLNAGQVKNNSNLLLYSFSYKCFADLIIEPQNCKKCYRINKRSDTYYRTMFCSYGQSNTVTAQQRGMQERGITRKWLCIC